MIRFIAAIGFIAASWSYADACDPIGPPPDEVLADRTVVPWTPPKLTTDQIIANLPEIVIDGEIVEHDPIKGDFEDGTPKTARMRVDHVWKGDIGPFVTLHFSEDSASCNGPPPVGRRFMMEGSFFLHREVRFDIFSEAPLDDPDLNRALAEYKRRTDAMLASHASGGRADRQAIAEYFDKNGEVDRALQMFQQLYAEDSTDLDALLRIALLQSRAWQRDEAEGTLSRLNRIAPHTEAWRGKISRAEFETRGLLRDGWKDWSDVSNDEPCVRTNAKFDNAVFDRAHLYCRFAGTTFRHASFKGADLSSTRFEEHVNLTGALYDCGTRFADGFDPKRAGMINTEGNCAVAPPAANP